MTARAWAVAVIGFLAPVTEASAHTVLGITGFAGGLLHPLLVLSHLAALIALALLIGQQQRLRSLPIVFAIALIASLGAIALAYVPTYAEPALLTLAAVIGAMVALARPLPWMVRAALAAATGLAIGLDSPPEAISLPEANLTLAGTALSAIALLFALSWLAAQIRRDWQRIGVRIIGSWIAASAIMVLALRLAAD